VGGTWHVAYGTETLTFGQPDPQLASHFVMIVPKLVINNGSLVSLSWAYRNPASGAVLGSVADRIARIKFSIYGGDFTRCGPDDNTIFETPLFDSSVTNFVLSSPIVWSNLMLAFTYEDTLNNSYLFFSSFGNLYEVYGANSYSDIDYCNPTASGFMLLGSATNTATFTGAYNYYLVRAPKHNVVKVDTVRGSNGLYYNTYVTGNTSDYQYIGGPPDGLCATVGPTPRGFYTGGLFVIDAIGQSLSSITVYTVP
jgi:hypothetical protein